MKVSATFPVRNGVFCAEAFLVCKRDLEFSLHHDNGFLQSVYIARKGLPESVSPSVIRSEGRDDNPIRSPDLEIKLNHDSILEGLTAEVRRWQALMAAYAWIDIDYGGATVKFHPDPGENVALNNIKAGARDRPIGLKTYDVYARAFLADGDAGDFTEASWFFLEGMRAIRQQQYIHAYNEFYLFIESTVGNGKFKTKEISRALCSSDSFMEALKEISSRNREGISSFGWSQDIGFEVLVKKIVELRGFLRHHSTKNKGSWKPREQHEFFNQAIFISQVCQQLLFQKATSLWGANVLDNFLEQAHERNFEMSVLVEISYLDDNLPRNKKLRINSLGAEMVTTRIAGIMQKVFDELERHAPHAEVLVVRGVDEKTSREIFHLSMNPVLFISGK